MKNKNANYQSNQGTYEIRKEPGTRNVSTPSVSKISTKQPPKPKK